MPRIRKLPIYRATKVFDFSKEKESSSSMLALADWETAPAYTRNRFRSIVLPILTRLGTDADLLDVGCGTGLLAHYIRQQPKPQRLKSYTGVEPNKRAAVTAAAHLPKGFCDADARIFAGSMHDYAQSREHRREHKLAIAHGVSAYLGANSRPDWSAVERFLRDLFAVSRNSVFDFWYRPPWLYDRESLDFQDTVVFDDKLFTLSVVEEVATNVYGSRVKLSARNGRAWSDEREDAFFTVEVKTDAPSAVRRRT